MGEFAVLEQIRLDARALDSGSVIIGPFARLDADAVAAREGKTRGAITNLFGSQRAFRAETMSLVLLASDLVEDVDYPAPADFATADLWIEAFFAGQSARGPAHGNEPTSDYAALWLLWLSVVPYGMWSEAVAAPSLAENREWLGLLETVFQGALDHFGLRLRPGVDVADLACATAGLVEGLWLNQCLSSSHLTDPAEPIATAMLRSGRLLWWGATLPSD